MMNSDRDEAIRQIAEAAVESERRTGLPAELTAAQCILESGWLSHSPGNNCFGIKFASRHKDSQLLLTTEYRNGTPVKEFHRFAKFATLGDCFADHAQLITTKVAYAKPWAQYQLDRDLTALIKGIAPKYATDPNYASKVLAMVQRSDLSKAIGEARKAA